MLGVSRRLVQRLGGRGGFRRAYSQDLLKEEERAAENMYIKKMEEERMERLRRAAQSGGSHAAETAADGTPTSPEGAAMARNKAIAMAASAVALFSLGYWVFSSPPTSKKDKEQE